MMYNLYSIYDVVAKECGPIFQAKNKEVACRYVAEMLKSNPVKLSEYYLCYLGNFDSDSGTIFRDTVEKWSLEYLFNVDSKEVDDVDIQ